MAQMLLTTSTGQAQNHIPLCRLMLKSRAFKALTPHSFPLCLGFVRPCGEFKQGCDRNGHNTQAD